MIAQAADMGRRDIQQSLTKLRTAGEEQGLIKRPEAARPRRRDTGGEGVAGIVEVSGPDEEAESPAAESKSRRTAKPNSPPSADTRSDAGSAAKPRSTRPSRAEFDAFSDDRIEAELHDRIGEAIKAASDRVAAIKELSDGQRALWITISVEAAVKDGGFAKFFSGPDGSLAGLAPGAFAEIGARRSMQ